MLRTIAAALIAASMLTAPALAENTAPATAQAIKAPATKPAVEVVKVKKHFKRHAHARVHVKHVRVARHSRHHVRHASVKRVHSVHVARSAPKAVTN